MKKGKTPYMTASQNDKENQFPRTSQTPNQSPKYWVKEKDRYLRQLLIGDIQETTGRELVVFFSVNHHQSGNLDFNDADDLSEVLDGCKTNEIDLLVQTPGGNPDACEKLISILDHRLDNYRVLVPSWAKSAGTIVAISSSEIIMGLNSELGPIDPHFNGIPAEFIKDDPAQNYPTKKLAEHAIERTKRLAKSVLAKGMLKDRDEVEVDNLVTQLSSATNYFSHGAVINATEAKSLGLNVTYLDPNEILWKQIWLLYCMYDYDFKIRNYAKIFEGKKNSITRLLPKPQNP